MLWEKSLSKKKRQQTNYPIQIPSKTVFVFIPAWNQPTKSHRITNEMTQNLNEYQAAIKIRMSENIVFDLMNCCNFSE